MTFKTIRNVLLTFVLPTLSCTAQLGFEDSELIDNDPPLANIDDLLAGAPKADEIPRVDYKTDEINDERFLDLLSSQSPVRSQGKRGVCSIFSTVGLMEHLYMLEGSMPEPDFSEQYLQWSAKFEINSFPNSSGSNAQYNLSAISNYGIVEEQTWPFERNQWGLSEDTECDGDDSQPTRCYTNGHPSDDVKNAEKFSLPHGRYLSSRDIKQHLFNEGTAVVAGMTFFYQSWNHRKSELTTNKNSWNNGWVVYPSNEDKKISLEKRAGHSILLVGWDDSIELPMLDENGEQQIDSDGEPVVDKGCYIFKNSWGTGNFGADSEFGDGFGCISYSYVHEYASLRVSDIPELETSVNEICDDELDNDGNGAIDCDDTACESFSGCEVTDGFQMSLSNNESSEIPDNDSVGTKSSILVEENGTMVSLNIEVDIAHTFIGDLQVTLVHNETSVVLHNQTGGGTDNLVRQFEVEDFNGEAIEGAWTLVVVDTADADVGTLDGWTMNAIVE